MAFHEVQWYDRNPIPRVANSNAVTLAPHPLTQRLTYTCPKDKMAYVELMKAYVCRDGVATANFLVQVYWAYRPSGGTEEAVVDAWIMSLLVGTTNQKSGSIMLFEGDRIRGLTWDPNPDGTIAYILAYKLTEFDAYQYRDPQKTVPLPPGENVQEPKKEPGLVEWIKGFFEPDPVM